ncbi:MAG: hypothetical protein JWO73_508 [Candidatus Taylorbacteria bacterium]|nr:hypothetical protein [Candidatus Taylorbacteria bacterium]
MKPQRELGYIKCTFDLAEKQLSESCVHIKTIIDRMREQYQDDLYDP